MSNEINLIKRELCFILKKSLRCCLVAFLFLFSPRIHVTNSLWNRRVSSTVSKNITNDIYRFAPCSLAWQLPFETLKEEKAIYFGRWRQSRDKFSGYIAAKIAIILSVWIGRNSRGTVNRSNYKTLINVLVFEWKRFNYQGILSNFEEQIKLLKRSWKEL